MSKVDKLRSFLKSSNRVGTDAFTYSPIVSTNFMNIIYHETGVIVYENRVHDYLVVAGLSKEDFNSLADILNIV